jgi:hypothetical protein
MSIRLKCHQHCSNLVRREGSEFFFDLAATPDQPVLSSPISMLIADGIEDRSLIGKESSSLVITRLSRLAAGIRRPFDRSLAVPIMRNLDT